MKQYQKLYRSILLGLLIAFHSHCCSRQSVQAGCGSVGMIMLQRCSVIARILGMQPHSYMNVSMYNGNRYSLTFFRLAGCCPCGQRAHFYFQFVGLGVRADCLSEDPEQGIEDRVVNPGDAADCERFCLPCALEYAEAGSEFLVALSDDSLFHAAGCRHLVYRAGCEHHQEGQIQLDGPVRSLSQRCDHRWIFRDSNSCLRRVLGPDSCRGPGLHDLLEGEYPGDARTSAYGRVRCADFGSSIIRVSHHGSRRATMPASHGDR